jgi:hypothetical membrane protein
MGEAGEGERREAGLMSDARHDGSFGLKVGILCGVLAPLLWAAAIAFCGTLRPGFSHFTQYISELGERGSSTELLMRYGAFIPTGLMHLAFAGAIAVIFRSSRLGVAAALLIGLNGLARIGAGFFPCDIGCEETGSLGQRMHSFSAAVGFLALAVSTVLWSVALRRAPNLRSLAWYSVASGVLGLAFLLLMVWSAEPGAARGLFERLSSGVLSLWILVFALRLQRR